jgi:subtilisin family serine protease
MTVLLRSLIGGLLLAAILAGTTASLATGSSGAASVVGQYIVVLKPGADRAAEIAYARSLGGDVLMQYKHALNGFAVRLPAAALSTIERRSSILFVSVDAEVRAAACDPSVGQCLPTGVDRIEGDRSTAKAGDGRGSVGVNLAVIDTGIAAHPDLNVVGGVDCQSGEGFADPDGHGTHVAGTIAAEDNRVGVVGVAPGARLFAVRVLNKHGFGTFGKIICGIDWVTGTRVDSDSTNDVAVANMSLLGPGADDSNCGRTNKDALHLAICNSTAAGVVYVVAAGNSGQDFQARIPASYDEVLTVTAVTDFDGRPGALASPAGSCVPPDFQSQISDDSAVFFSNFATLAADQAHTIAAPGVCILSTVPPDSSSFPPGTFYDYESGTSMSSPHIAGTVALCIASGPCAGLTPPQIIQKIVGDAAAYNTKTVGYGFQGDPLRPVSGKYYGHLIRAGLY